jgi:hypothetical protein
VLVPVWTPKTVVAGATIWSMPTREQLHKEVDAVPEDQLDNAQIVVDSNGTGGSNGVMSNAARRARNFLISVADGTSGLDLGSLRTVRDRAWR